MAEEAGPQLNERAFEHLIRSGKWARFVSIWLFIWAGLASVSSLYTLIITGSLSVILTALVKIVPPVFLAVYLNCFARRIRDFEPSCLHGSLEDVFRAQYKFWRLAGIIIVCYLVIVVVAYLVMIATQVIYLH